MKNTRYRQLTEALLYASTGTRPYIAAALSIVCKFNEYPEPEHWEAISTAGYVFMLGSYPIAWKSKLQVITAISSMEAELMAISAANQEALWIRKFLKDIGYPQKAATIFYEDNQSCIHYIYGTKFSPKSKHIGGRHYFIRDSVKDGEVEVKYVPTENQTADIHLGPLKVMNHRNDGLCMKPVVGRI